MRQGKRAIVLLSGGIDSTTTMAIAQDESFDIYALSFDYGQRHKVELECARNNAEKFRAREHFTINLNLQDIGRSALTSDIDVPRGALNSSQIPVTYVPARNTIFLSFALAWAETLEASDIFIGANAIDYSGYPDCRPEFLEAFENMANLATKASVEGTAKFSIHAPLIKMTKGEIIKRGADLGVDYSHTWSCYDPQPQETAVTPCLRCDSCQLRAKGFLESGIEDTLLEIS